ncbi:lipid-binding SYLF domain-containing protein [Schlesneria paludicola]|uniref:lipid-binding SYLF domain-containing protein n=1 Tax=Schlesneria paludicola TaxID=360056 RepID=UPI000299D337|nr:lipid-binding SYLF domain-containing protein [Schlesneria paludicola]
MRKYLMLATLVAVGISACATSFAQGPAEKVVEAEQVLSELMAIPAKQIPARLLEDAQGIVVVPNVIKIGFIAGARRGHGVVMTRDADGEWSLPQFVTLTGGSVGWQAGIQGTDVVLVFTTRKGVEGLLSGKFTVGVDAAVTAGPVGREAAAGTDETLRAEIYSYSRSRGLFVGVSLDGSALEIDHEAHAFFYGSPSGELPRRVPAQAAELRHYLTEITPHGVHVGPGNDRPVNDRPVIERPAPVASPRQLETIRRSLLRSSDQLQAILNPEWRPYLGLPNGIQEPGMLPTPEHLSLALQRFAHVSNSPEYQRLTKRPEFQNTFELLREYEQAVASIRPTLQLPPPPVHLHEVRPN